MAGQKGSLKMVARLNAEAERQAGEALRSAQERLAEEESQLETVRSLVEDYESRAAFAGGQLKQLRDARDFVAQLQSGLQAQIIAVESQRRLTEAARAQWVSARMQREAIDRLIEERGAADERQRERSEQRQIDDRIRRRDSDLSTGTTG